MSAVPRALRRALPLLLLFAAATTGRGAVAQGAATSPVPAGGAGSGYDRGVRAFEARQYPAARGELAAFVKSNPRHAAANYYLGRAFYADTSWDDAVKWLEKAAELEPRNAQYHFWLGNAYGAQAQRANKLRQGFLAKKVKNEFERAVQLEPENLDAREGLIEFYMQAPGFMGGSVDKAKVEAAQITKRNAYRGRFDWANRIYRRQKDNAAMEREFRQLIADFPDSTGPYHALGMFYQNGGRAEEAFATYDQLRQRRPKDMVAVYAIGRVGAVSGQQLDRAEQALKAYLQYTPGPNDPTHAGAHWRLGQIYEKRGNKAAARTEYETALRMDPKLKGAQESLKGLK